LDRGLWKNPRPPEFTPGEKKVLSRRITKHEARQSKIMLSVQTVKAKCRPGDRTIEKNGDYPKTPMEMGVFTYSASG